MYLQVEDKRNRVKVQIEKYCLPERAFLFLLKRLGPSWIPSPLPSLPSLHTHVPLDFRLFPYTMIVLFNCNLLGATMSKMLKFSTPHANMNRCLKRNTWLVHLNFSDVVIIIFCNKYISSSVSIFFAHDCMAVDVVVIVMTVVSLYTAKVKLRCTCIRASSHQTLPLTLQRFSAHKSMQQ